MQWQCNHFMVSTKRRVLSASWSCRRHSSDPLSCRRGLDAVESGSQLPVQPIRHEPDPQRHASRHPDRLPDCSAAPQAQRRLHRTAARTVHRLCESERCLALRCSLLGRLNAHAVITDCIRQPPALATFAPSPAASEVVSQGVSKGVSKGVAPPVWRQRRPRSKSCDELKQKLALARCSLFGRLNAQADLSVLTAAIRPPPAAAAVCSAPPPSAADVAMADVVKEVAVSLGGCDSPVRTRPRVEVPWAPIAKSRHISRTISRTIRPRCKFGKLGLNLDKPVQHELLKKRLAEHGAHSHLESASPVSLRIGA